MNRTRTVAGLDVHKDSIYLCIMGYDQAIIWENTYGVLNTSITSILSSSGSGMVAAVFAVVINIQCV